MVKRCALILLLTSFFVFAFYFFTDAVVEKPLSHDESEYFVPEDKKKKWDSIKNMVHKEHEVCNEHCGYDTDCLDRCTEAYKFRLDREYKKMMLE